ncbi:MAG: alpha/beta hydrolase [Planctomycetota bacterium]|nr:alpha/beta hydrolase [Planctomycetota bacterium]
MKYRFIGWVVGSLFFAFGAVSQELDRSPSRDRGRKVPEGIELREGVVFATYGKRKLKMDLLIPEKAQKPLRFLVFVHGGGWRSGNRQSFRRQAYRMVSKGYGAALIEYRLSGEATFPAAIHDCKAAVRWLRAHAEELGIDSGRIAAVGGSAGGHLAAFLGTTAHLKRFEGEGGCASFSSQVHAVVAFNPALDFEDFAWRCDVQKYKNSLIPFLGGSYLDNPKIWIDASPITHVSSRSAPFLILHGTSDPVVPYRQSVSMTEALRRAGVEVELFSAEGQGHSFFRRGEWVEKTGQAMEVFLERHLR